jgi:hypothetical protein
MEEDDAQSSHASNHSSAALVQPTFSSSTEAKSKIVVEKRDEVTKPGLSSTTTSTSPPPSQPNARKEMSNILLNRRLERNEPERRVVSVRTSGPSTASVATTGVSIVRAPDSDKIAISPLSVQKTFSVSVSC